MPLFRLGFRPFYLVGALIAAAAVPVWVANWLGWVDAFQAIAPLLWHAHEMIFGFGIAVIAGFLLTATKAWTGVPTPRSYHLAALVSIWVAGRIAALFAPYEIFAVTDLVFLPTLALVIFDVLSKGKNTKNMPLVGLLLVLAGANLFFHLAVLKVVNIDAVKPLHAAIGAITMIKCVMASRVIPAFTNNAIPGANIKPLWRIKELGIAFTGVGLVLWVTGIYPVLCSVLLLSAGLCHLVNTLTWKPWLVAKKPILWVLHLAYAWITIGLIFLACSVVTDVRNSVGIHALMVGSMGGLIIGMVTRTARGHTARPLLASPVEVAMYVLVMLAATLRVALEFLPKQIYQGVLLSAATCWTMAFVLYLIVYVPWLTKPRLDGKDG